MTRYYTWETHGEKDCIVCGALDGKTMAMEMWDMFITPGWHRFCDCSLAISHTIFDGNENITPNDPTLALLIAHFQNLSSSMQSITGHVVGSGRALSPDRLIVRKNAETYSGSDKYFLGMLLNYNLPYSWNYAPFDTSQDSGAREHHGENLRNDVEERDTFVRPTKPKGKVDPWERYEHPPEERETIIKVPDFNSQFIQRREIWDTYDPKRWG